VNAYLLLAVFAEDLVPIGLYPTRQEVDKAALLLNKESALEVNRNVFLDDDDLGTFFGPQVVRFQNGKPISVVAYPTNWADGPDRPAEDLP
jgi:hypothetical protein